MPAGFLTEVLLPVGLALIMLGLGLGLTLDDFRRVVLLPKAVLVGLAGQILCLPLLGWLVVSVFQLPPLIGVGLMILSVCPGGPTSNLITYLAKGDTALSVTLTAVGSLITAFTTPVLASLAVSQMAGQSATVTLSIPQTIGQIVLLTLVPVGIGLWIRAKAEGFALRAEKPLGVISLVFLLLVVVGAILRERENLGGYFAVVGGAALALNLLALGLGFGLGWALKLRKEEGLCIGVEMGIQNGTMALFITGTLLRSDEMTVAPAVYSLLMFVTGGLVIAFSPLRRKAKEAQ